MRSDIALIAVIASACVSAPLFASDDGLPTPISQYPAFYCYLEDAEGALSGYVAISFTVTREGNVRDPVVIRSEACVREAIPRIEAIATESLVEQFRYKPPVVDGESVEVPDVKTRILFYYDPRPRGGTKEERSWNRWEFLEFVKQYAEENPEQLPPGEASGFKMFVDDQLGCEPVKRQWPRSIWPPIGR